MKYLTLLGILAIVLILSGCIGNNAITDFTKNLPEVQAFLEENPDAEITAVFLNEGAVSNLIGDIRKLCGPQMEEIAYWHVYVTKGEEQIEAFLDKSGQQALCVIKTGTAPPDEAPIQDDLPENECNSNTDCNDRNPCTTDLCTGSPKKCSTAQITSCTSEDGCCPQGCVYEFDSDCPETDQCRTDNDCDDQDDSTTDVCGGTPKRCDNTLKACAEIGGDLCDSGEDCTLAYTPASNTSKCCPIACTTSAPCLNVTCLTSQKCVGGTCILKTCSERGGKICYSGTSCSESTVTTLDSSQCCLGICPTIDPCAGITCSSGEQCSNGNCVSTDACAGITCAANKTCENGSCVLKTCSEMSGQACAQDETCSTSTITTSDSAACCTGTCTTEDDSCTDVFCGYYEKCVQGSCQLKSCSELNGVACSQDQGCIGGIVRATSDTDTCCTSVSGGMICQDTVACTNDTDCEDGDPDTHDFCYGVIDKFCEQIPEPIESHNNTKAKEEALARSSLTDYCNEADIYNANAFTYGMLSYTQQELDEVNNGPPRTCGLQSIWGWCKDWWLECVDGQTRKIEQILTHKTPNQDNYTMAIKVNPWDVPV
jgi:hypothetical protein